MTLKHLHKRLHVFVWSESYIHKSMPFTPATNVNQNHKKQSCQKKSILYQTTNYLDLYFSIKAYQYTNTLHWSSKGWPKNLKQFAASHYQDLTNNFLLSSTIQAFKCDRQCFSLTSNAKESNLLENITRDHKISIQTKFICRHVHISSLCSGAIPPF